MCAHHRISLSIEKKFSTDYVLREQLKSRTPNRSFVFGWMDALSLCSTLATTHKDARARGGGICGGIFNGIITKPNLTDIISHCLGGHRRRFMVVVLSLYDDEHDFMRSQCGRPLSHRRALINRRPRNADARSLADAQAARDVLKTDEEGSR